MKDTGTALKRAQKTIKYFMRALECDKFMVVLLLFVALALVAVIVLLIKKGWQSFILLIFLYKIWYFICIDTINYQ